MNILVSNDDGIKARGIETLVNAMAEIDGVKLFVSAPNEQRSAAGHSITIRGGLIAEEIDMDNVEKAYSVNGTPADCVKLGIMLLKEQGIEIDMVFSGINHGGNLGTDTHYSGTVSAAMEGCICGKPSIAFSIEAENNDPKHFDGAAWAVKEVYRQAAGKFQATHMLNVNLPDLPKEGLKGIKITELGPRDYSHWFIQREDTDGVLKYWYSGKPVLYDGLSADLDVAAIAKGYVSVSPLRCDFAEKSMIDEVEGWFAE